MGRLALLGAVVAAVLGVFGLAGNGPATAVAGNPAKPDPPGQQQTPPGQAAKAEDDQEKPTPPGQAQTPPGQAAKDSADQTPATPAADGAASSGPETESGPPKGAAKEAHGKQSSASSPQSGRPASAPGQSDQDKPATSTKTKNKKPAPATRSATAQRHVILCHRTGSDSNPYVVINVSVAAWLHGHSTHPPLHGRNDIVLDPDAKPGEKLPETACADRGGVVTSDPPQATTSTEAKDPGASATDPANAPSEGTSADDPGEMSSATHTEASTGGVATARRLSQSAVRTTLPFTGVPLWIVLIASTALVGGGLVLRRAPVPQASGRRAATRETGLYWRRGPR